MKWSVLGVEWRSVQIFTMDLTDTNPRKVCALCCSVHTRRFVCWQIRPTDRLHWTHNRYLTNLTLSFGPISQFTLTRVLASSIRGKRLVPSGVARNYV